jgi:UDP-3-O-[3-hydroxymyristoyl] N-acetylglucosamine deacetylase
LLRVLLAQPDSYDTVTFDQESRAPKGFAQLALAW